MGRGLLLIGLCVLNYFFTVSGNAEGDALIAFKNALTDHTGVFTSWNASLVNPCSWFHITCNNENSVTRVDLGTASLSGRLVKQLGVLSNLQYLELYNNHISGTIPLELGNLSNLASLDLYSNQLSGPIPDTLGKLSKLRFLRLNNNTLSGAIPYSLTAITSLQLLDFSNNNLSGVVPVNGSFSLFTPSSFLNNPYLDSSTILPPAQNPPPLPPPTTNPPPSDKGSDETGKRAAIVGFFLFFILSFSCTFCWRGIPISATLAWWRRMICQDPFFDVQAEEDAVFLCLGQLKRFSLRELLVATDNFSHKNVVGKGGFAKVYKGRLADGSLVAVKRLKEEHTRGGELQFLTEVEMISMAVHRNLLRLKGFCVTPTERLLVYPYMSNGSLASCLRACEESQPPLDWPKRKQIALGSATGLTYLHEHCDPKIIHRNVKAANILLDDKFEAVMGDFGLAKLMDYKDTHVITIVCGTTGHIAPEYLSMGKSSEKTDVFGYGVMLLELITGQRAFDLARLARKEGFMFLDWVNGLLKDERFESLVDANLQGKCPQEEVEELIQIALLCTQTSALQRPKMSEVVRLLEGEGLAERWEVSQEFRHELIDTCCHNKDFVVDSTGNLRPDQLSGPR